MRFEIAGQPVGPDAPLFVVAELGLNHGGSVGHALALVDAAAEAGASAVKLQSFEAGHLVAPSCPAPAHVDVPSLQAFFERFELDEAAHVALAARARTRGLAFISTPFSLAAVDMLERVGVDAYKIASGDLTYDDLIARCAATGRPLIISTGMASLDEVGNALAVARVAGARAVALLHCVSAYPVPHAGQNLRAMVTLAEHFQTPVGLSDHAQDTSAVPLVVALGGVMYERHLMFGGEEGVDAAVSSSPRQLAEAVLIAGRTATALGHGRVECLDVEAVNVVPSRRSLRARRTLAAGSRVSADDLLVVRPGDGLSPNLAGELVGTVLRRDVLAGDLFLNRDLPGDWSRRGVA